MTTPLERLDKAHEEVTAATGPDFLRRLGDYADLLAEDEVIGAEVARIKDEVADAHANFAAQDAEFVASLIPIRHQLSEREPEVDDSAAPYPGDYSNFDPEKDRELLHWTWTLANFDAVAEDRNKKVIQQRDLDASRSRMLVAILEAKLHDLVFPFNERPAPRPDLRDLWDATTDVGHSQVEAYEQVERLMGESGFFALQEIEEVASRTKPKPRRRLKTREEKHEILEEALKAPDLMRIPAILRPEAARGPLNDEEKEALARIEVFSQAALERLHRPLRSRLMRREPPVSGSQRAPSDYGSSKHARIELDDLPKPIASLIDELHDNLNRGNRYASALLTRKIIHDAVFIAMQMRGKEDLLLNDEKEPIDLGPALEQCRQEYRLTDHLIKRTRAAKWLGDNANHSYRMRVYPADLDQQVMALRLFLGEVFPPPEPAT